MTTEHSHVELLAPAGDPTCLHAAVRAGADAVYLGLEVFNARRGAGNFSLRTLREGCAYAHLRGVKVYLTLNTVIMESELAHAMESAGKPGVRAWMCLSCRIWVWRASLRARCRRRACIFRRR